MTTPLLQLTDVFKSFGRTRAVRSASFSVAPGELFFLLGPSGCGKTTVLRIIAGLETPDEGQVLLKGMDITALPPEKRKMGVVFQQYALWPHMTLAQNLAFGLELQSLPAAEITKRVAESLAIVRMPELSDRYPHQLSGGQQQRAAIARALALAPALLLLDEPLSNLDARLRQEIRAEIKRIQRETGMTMIVVSHDQHEALSTASSIAVMNAGQVLQTGTPELLYNRPESSFTASFLGDANIVSAEVRADHRAMLPGGAAFALPANVEPGKRLLLIRPERVQFSSDGFAGAIPARVLERSFHGAYREYLLEIASGVTLRKLALSPERTDPAAGEQVAVTVLPEDIAVLES